MRTSRTRSVALCGLCIALLAVSAAISVPLGPVPFTLQTLVLVLICCVLTPGEAIATVACYLLFGAIGLPIFSGMRGGLAILAGPTGGFLVGYLVSALVACPLRSLLVERGVKMVVGDVAAAVIIWAITYLLGFIQLMFVAQLDPVSAFAAGIAPFIIPDLAKVVVAITLAVPIRIALGRQVKSANARGVSQNH